MKKSTLALCLGVALTTTAANAEVDLLGFTGPVNLGLNLDLTDYELATQSFIAAANLGQRFDIYNVGLKLTAVNNASKVSGETERTAENYKVEASTGRDLDEKQSINGVLAWNKDQQRFAGYETDSSLSLQYGYKAIASDNENLTFGIGPAYIIQTFDGADDESSFGGIATANYDKRITENLTFAQGLSTSFAGGDLSNIIDSTTSLNYAFDNSLTVGLIHLTKFIDADDGFEETTTPSTKITIGYTY